MSAPPALTATRPASIRGSVVSVAATSRMRRLGNGIPAASIRKAQKTIVRTCSSRKSRCDWTQSMRRLARQCIPATPAAKGTPASYGVSDYAVGRLSAKHINRVLLGADPGSLPAERLYRLHYVVIFRILCISGRRRSDQIFRQALAARVSSMVATSPCLAADSPRVGNRSAARTNGHISLSVLRHSEDRCGDPALVLQPLRHAKRAIPLMLVGAEASNAVWRTACRHAVDYA